MIQICKTTALILFTLSSFIFTGCAQFVGGNFSDLLVDSPNKDLENYKFDPLPNQENSLTRISINDARENEGNDFAPIAELDNEPKDAQSPTIEKPVIRLEPVATSPAKPTDKEQEFKQARLHRATPSNADNDSFVPSKTGNSIRTRGTAKKESNDAEFLLKPRETSVPVGIAPTPTKRLPAFPGDSELDAELESDLDAFVSDQMKLLQPPFANHPDTIVFNAPPQLALEDPVIKEADDPANDTLEPVELPDFVDDLIAESMSPDSLSFVSAAKKTTASEPLTWSSQLDKTIDVFELERQQVEDDNRALQLESSLQILRSMKQHLAIDTTESERHFNQDYWIHQIDALNAVMASENEDWPNTATIALDHLNEAIRPLREAANLKLSSASFCRKVSGFGQYQKFESRQFRPGQRVLVYCEIENFLPTESTNKDGGMSFQTKISSSFWIENSVGKVLQRMDFPPVSDYARKIRTDFFMHIPIHFNEFPPGEYRLYLQVDDYGSGKTATLDRPMKFTIR